MLQTQLMLDSCEDVEGEKKCLRKESFPVDLWESLGGFFLCDCIV